MSKPELTKKMIADTLKVLVLKTPIDKITIHDIVETSGINRTTFYYHFHDKQSLICWIFNEEFDKYNHSTDSGELLIKIVNHMYKEKAFYVPAMLSEVQNNLRNHIYALAYDRCMIDIREHLGKRHISEHSTNFIANYFANAVIGSIVQWAKDGMIINPNELELNIAPITSDCIKLVIDRYVK